MDVLCRRAAVSASGVTMLAPLDAELPARLLTTVSGPNGSGKSTLLSVIAGRRTLTSGRCLVDGSPPDESSGRFREAVASFIDTPPLARDLTVREQTAVVGASWWPYRDPWAGADAQLTALEAAHLSGRFVHELSAGELQLVMLALTCHRPSRLLLLDEPERHLDEERICQLGDLLKQRAQAGTTVVLATHDHRLMEQADCCISLAAADRTP
ncbi:ABC transporter ATP-binding protein [Nesterenkonia sp. HG001]|uniref:ABC transporter ATP-binding protein n=1 Tax=Nesterenkonia sp. HG001 TaxID=2983207 RepID=UPI002AC4F879|nr:ABC transporter ATP-binding protein [Nesterenkonia sp. HG001]MDZ5078446.1 ABC transporter ATP-binding protein [Nesterenkonia sp. HG001]